MNSPASRGGARIPRRRLMRAIAAASALMAVPAPSEATASGRAASATGDGLDAVSDLNAMSDPTPPILIGLL